MHLNLSIWFRISIKSTRHLQGEYDFRMPDYKRVDIGFSVVLKKEGEKKKVVQSVKLYQNSMDKFRSF